MAKTEVEQQINDLICEVENGLRNGHITTLNPIGSLEYHTKLSAWLSTCYGLIERLDTEEAKYFINNRKDHKSDNATKKAWEYTDEGIEQKFWETRIQRIGVLIKALERVYYHARDEAKIREMK